MLVPKQFEPWYKTTHLKRVQSKNAGWTLRWDKYAWAHNNLLRFRHVRNNVHTNYDERVFCSALVSFQAFVPHFPLNNPIQSNFRHKKKKAEKIRTLMCTCTCQNVNSIEKGEIFKRILVELSRLTEEQYR